MSSSSESTDSPPLGEAGLVSRLRSILGPLGWGALVVFLITRFGDAANLICRVYLGHTLSPVDFGAMDPVFSASGLLTLPLFIYFQVAVKSISRLRAVGDEPRYRALARDMTWVTLIVSLAFVGVVVVAGPYLISRLRLPSFAFVWVLAALQFFTSWAFLWGALQQGHLNYRHMARTAFFASAFILTGTFVLVGWLSWGLLGALVAKLFAGLSYAVALWVVLRPVFRGARMEYAAEARLMRDMAVPMAVFMSATYVLLYLPPLFVRNFAVAQSGGFGAVLTLGILAFHAISSVVYVVFPLASADHAANRDLERFRRRAVWLGLALTTTFAVGTLVLAGPLLALWNPAFAPYAELVWVFSVATGLHGTIQIMASIEMARHRYAFLWLLVVPALLMCGFLYAFRTVLTVGFVVYTVAAVHVLIFGALLVVRALSSRE